VAARRAIHWRAIFGCKPPSFGRQICPPAPRPSSNTTTERPASATRHAAASPAGPAPTIATSHECSPALIRTPHSRLHAHPAADTPQACALLRHVVDRHAAFEADPHSAYRTTCFADNGFAKDVLTGVHERGGDGRAGRRRHWLPIHDDLDATGSHEC